MRQCIIGAVIFILLVPLVVISATSFRDKKTSHRPPTTSAFVVTASEYFSGQDTISYINVIKDKETGQEYIAVIRSGNIAITPRLPSTTK